MQNSKTNDKSSMLAKRLEENMGLILLAIILLGAIVVLRPFFSALLWAAILCFSSWPLYRRLAKGLGNRRTFPALIMTLALTLAVLMPFVLIGFTLADNMGDVPARVQDWFNAPPSDPPEWLAKIPWIGHSLPEYWKNFSADKTKLFKSLKPLLEPTSTMLIKLAAGFGHGILELTFSIFIAFFLFLHGVAAADRLTSAVNRLGGTRGKHLLIVAGSTIRGVVYGILGTALAQAIVAGIGFLIAGIPRAGLLTLLTFFLSVLPFGPPLIWIPAGIWLFTQGEIGWGIFMLIWGIGVSSIDNFIKPWLISKESKLPFILIFFGVLGGAMAFGFIGVFLGPTLLTLGYNLLAAWTAVPSADPPVETDPQ
jgi:predicted PurR-regulated permease PerM